MLMPKAKNLKFIAGEYEKNKAHTLSKNAQISKKLEKYYFKLEFDINT